LAVKPKSGVVISLQNLHEMTGDKFVGLRILGSVLIVIWLALLMAGKGGFIHLLVLNGLAIWVVDSVSRYRAQMTESL
jgi:hypothetical protein